MFNRLRELEQGDVIRVQSATHEYVYRVASVRLTTAQEAFIPFGIGEKRLTLTTCNSFGAKSERWVVDAEYVGSYLLPEYISVNQ